MSLFPSIDLISNSSTIYWLIIKILIMSHRESWNPQIDAALSALVEQQEVPKWAKIAQEIGNRFKFRGISGKKCKARYLAITQNKQTSHLCNSISLEEDLRINELHNQLGNKWSVITKKLNEANLKPIQRNYNNIKNYFFIKLRKGLRIVNKTGCKLIKKSVKPIKQNFIKKLLEVTEERFRERSKFPPEIIQLSMRLKTWLYQLRGEQSISDIQQLKQYRQDVQHFLNNYKANSNKDDALIPRKTEDPPQIPKLRKNRSEYLECLQIDGEESIEIIEDNVRCDDGKQDNGKSKEKGIKNFSIDDQLIEDELIGQIVNLEQQAPSQMGRNPNMDLLGSFYEMRIPSLYNSLNEYLSINLSGSWGLR